MMYFRADISSDNEDDEIINQWEDNRSTFQRNDSDGCMRKINCRVGKIVGTDKDDATSVHESTFTTGIRTSVSRFLSSLGSMSEGRYAEPEKYHTIRSSIYHRRDDDSSSGVCSDSNYSLEG